MEAVRTDRVGRVSGAQHPVLGDGAHVLGRGIPGQGHVAAVHQRGGEIRRSQVLRVVGHLHCGPVGRLALFLTPQGLDRIGVGCSLFRGGRVGVGGGLVAGVGHQDRQLRLTLSAKDHVAAHRAGLFRRGVPV